MVEPMEPRSRSPDTRFTAILGTIVAVLGGIQSFMWRNMMDADGMSYVDVAYTYLRGDWQWAINGYWSPLYSWMIAALLAIFDPAPAVEFQLIQGLDFFNFLLSLAAFSFFIRQLFTRFADEGLAAGHHFAQAWTTLGYAAFAYSSIALQDVGRGGPDFLLAACFYLASGLLLRVDGTPRTSLPVMTGFGFVLAVGYLAKAIMFPIALVMLASLFVIVRKRERGLIGAALAVVAFAAVSTPWIATLSSVKGRITYGDTGKLNYGWYVVDAAIMHAQESPAHGKPAHPTRRLSSGPVVYEFATPVPGTYPVWYDPSYWHEGVDVKFSPRLQVRRLAMSIQDLQSQSWFYPTAAALIALLLLAGRAAARRALRSTWFIMLPVAAGFGLYALVLILTRHIAPFFVVGLTTLAVAVAASMKWGSHDDRRGAAMTAFGLAAVLTIMSLSQIVFVDRRLPEGRNLAVASALHRRGVAQGSRVGVIGDSMHAYWAHLGRFRIVAEILPEQTAWFWSQDPMKRAQQLELFRTTGAAAVIADHVPSWADKTGWAPIGNSGYWAWVPRSGT